MSPKYIANRIKAKGLQKLRWYCQMCGKQCRDENGFKCHLTSESHKRQMEIFGQAPQKVIDNFSQEFESSFLEHLRRAHPFSRVSANVVYNEFIQDRQHVHMNSTQWLTLTEFVKYLGREGKCKVEDTPKGWYISLIQKDPFEEMDEKKRSKREREELDEEERHRKMLAEQIERARKAARTEDGYEAQEEGRNGAAEFKPEELEGPLKLSLAARPAAAQAVSAAAPFDDADDKPGPSGRGTSAGTGVGAGSRAGQHKKSKLEELMERDQRAKQQAAAADAALAQGTGTGTQRPSWLAEGIVVKVMSKALQAHGYYKQKGVVLRVLERYIGEIEMLGSGDVVRVDQAELETVIPKPGGAVLVVGGRWRGCKGTLEGIDEAAYKASVKVMDRTTGEKVTVTLEYEDFSKLA